MGTSGRSSSSPIPRQPTYLRDLLALSCSLSTRLRPFYECRQATSLSFIMAGRSLFSLVSLILVAGGLLLMFFILLAGAVDGSPLNKFYFLQASTGNLPGAPTIARWTYWNVCGVQNGRTVCGNQGYSDVHPAFPLDPASHRNFDTTTNVPRNFVRHHGYYFYMTRFMFAFMLIALFFGVCALFTGLLALCTRIGSYLSGLLPMSRVATTSAETVKALILANTLLGLNGRLWPVSSSPLSFSASVGEPDGTRLLLNDEDLVERDPGAPGAGAASSMIRSMGHNNARLRGR